MERRLLLAGETAAWTREPARPASPWSVLAYEDGALKEVERLPGDPARFLARSAGSFVAKSGQARVFFEVVDLRPRLSSPEGGAVRATLDALPPLDAPSVRWERVGSDGAVVSLEGPVASFSLPPAGRYELWPVVEIPGLPPLRGPEPLVLGVSDLSIVPPSSGLLPAGVPLPFEAASEPPLGPKARYEWTIRGGQTRTLTERGPVARLTLPGAGTWTVEVRSGVARSASLAVRAFHVRIEPADGASEVRTAADPGFDPDGRLPAAALERAPERARVVVEDPWGDPPASVSVATSDAGGAALNPPVPLPSPDGATGPVLFLADPEDDRATAAGVPDDAPGDPTFLARPGGRVEVFYRGMLSAGASVAPAAVCEVPVRFFFVADPALPRLDGLERAIDARLASANSIWEPHGLRFVRSDARRIDPPRHLLVLRGRAAGADARGEPGRVGTQADGREISLATSRQRGAAPLTPAAAGRELARGATGLSVDLFEGILAGDREAVILRLRRGDGAPAALEPLEGGEDLSQRAAPVRPVYSDGCEAAEGRGLVSLEEAALLLGARAARESGLDVFVVGGLRPAPRVGTLFFKAYPDGSYPAELAGAVVVSRELVDGTRFPYGLARAMSTVLLPEGHAFSPEDTLFADPLSESAGPRAHKRVGRATGRGILDPRKK
jgi:hypothetical protein